MNILQVHAMRDEIVKAITSFRLEDDGTAMTASGCDGPGITLDYGGLTSRFDKWLWNDTTDVWDGEFDGEPDHSLKTTAAVVAHSLETGRRHLKRLKRGVM